MNPLQALPPWLALATGGLVLIGALLAFIGSLGLLRLNGFYARVHAPTLGTTLGMGSMLAAAVLFFSLQQGRLVVHVILIGVFLTLSTPIGLMLLVRAALARDRMQDTDDVPSAQPSGIEAADDPDTPP